MQFFEMDVKLLKYYAANKIPFKDFIEFGYFLSWLANISEGAGPHWL